MLAKHTCTRCGHAFLADPTDLMTIDCPKCQMKMPVEHELPADLATGFGPVEETYEPMHVEERHAGAAPRFNPTGPPPVFVTRERLVRGLVFGGITATVIGGAVGAALAALDIAVPALAGIVIGLACGTGCRYGFAGRSVPQTKMAAASVAFLCTLLGFVAFLSGSWTIDRMTSDRATITRQDLDTGLEQLLRERELTHKSKEAGERILLDERIGETERLRELSDPQIEDYLWVQQARLNQPMLAYGKLKATLGPIVRLGPDARSIVLNEKATMGLLATEILMALVLAVRAVVAAKR
jgi:hypothetical protein